MYQSTKHGWLAYNTRQFVYFMFIFHTSNSCHYQFIIIVCPSKAGFFLGLAVSNQTGPSTLARNGPIRRPPSHNFWPGHRQRNRRAAISARRRYTVVVGGRSTEFGCGKRGSRVRRRRSQHQAQNHRGDRRWLLLHRWEQGDTCQKRRRVWTLLGGIAQALVPEASRIHRFPR